MDALRTRGGGEILVFGGGIVPDEDVLALKQIGVAEIFKPGASTQDIIAWVEKHVAPRLEARV